MHCSPVIRKLIRFEKYSGSLSAYNYSLPNNYFINFHLNFSVLGIPDEVDWPGVKNLCKFKDPVKGQTQQFCLEEMVFFRGLAFELLEMMLIFNPIKRISAKKILQHRYFDGFDPKLRYAPLQQKFNNNK